MLPCWFFVWCFTCGYPILLIQPRSMKALKPYSFRPHLHLLDLSKLGHYYYQFDQFALPVPGHNIREPNVPLSPPLRGRTRDKTSPVVKPRCHIPNFHMRGHPLFSLPLVKQCFVVIMRMKHAHTHFSSVLLFFTFLLFDATLTKVHDLGCA